ncbi:hypothetical protein GCM10022223_17390 [Kineosporia mesophila]|uniref:HTH luxR-type domain-containing protein n=1 Tax=Kineosporia mesophila TaxID=566012 RepID=A0ABP6ZCK4_9ACTN|nr:LuxR family transcriptional regulator [Kineosporia mesophila]
MSASVLFELRGPEVVPEQVNDRPELAVLSSRLARPENGPSSTVLRGAPGTGRSALLDALAAQAPTHGLRVLRACGAEAEAELPFSGLHQLLYPLREYIARLPGTQRQALNRAFGLTDGPEPSRFVISAAALALVDTAATAQGPLLLLVDDVVGIDPSSAEVLGFIARRLSGRPVLFLAAATDDDPATLTAGLPELRLRDTGSGTQSASSSDLTAQELRIADLAAQGLTNKQIGERLFLSHRTVSTHLYRIFPKLGISSRAALRDALAAH